MVLLLLFLTLEIQPKIEAKFTKTPPKIDGYIEWIWQNGDSVKNFIQQLPDEGKPATESTTVYLLYDSDNLYIAFQCFCQNLEDIHHQVVPRDKTEGDRAGFIIDTFDDQNTAYYFLVNAAGVQSDYYVFSDFRNWDSSWDGIWYSAAKLNGYGYCVEFQIPFRAIRYKPGISEWGINFVRYISYKAERTHWAAQPRQGYRVSLSGRLIGIKPGVKGLNLEIYPVGLCRYEERENIEIKPDAGLDVSWYLGSASTFQLTANPDFAQIEADPSQINLGKYELWFPERRPFFIEDAELFNLNGIQTFYSRRIGRPLPDRQIVPIIAGAKLVTKFKRTDVGFLNTICQKVNYQEDSIKYTEPLSYYGVFRLRQHILKNSNLGLLYTTKINQDSSHHSLSFDGVFQHQELAIHAQTAFSEFDSFDKLIHNWAHSYQVFYEGGKFSNTGEISYIPKDFDVNSTGFVTRKGLFWWDDFGPNFYNFAFLRYLSLRASVSGGREAGEEVNRFGTGLGFSCEYNNKWGNWIGFGYNRDFEMDSTYNQFSADIDFWSDESRPLSISAGFYGTSKTYNYRRDYFAPYANLFLETGWQINPSFKTWLGINSTVEWDTDNKIEAVGWILHPTFSYALTKDLHLRVYSEINLDSKIHYLNLLVSWNFRPKSWVYLAFNESRDNTKSEFELSERIAVLKLKYLFFF